MADDAITQLTHEVRAMRAELAAMRADMVALMRVDGARLSRDQVAARLDVHRNTLAGMVNDCRFPKPMPNGKWLLAAVVEWETEQGKTRPLPIR